MKPKFHVGGIVRITDHRKDREFYREHYIDYDKEWQRFWDEYVDRSLCVKDVQVNSYGKTKVYVHDLPDYVNPDVPFSEEELRGYVVSILPEELFHV